MGRTKVSWLWLVLLVLGAAAPTWANETLNQAGKAAYARGEYAEAEELFARAIKAAPNEPLYQYHRAVALTRLNRWDEAKASYEAALRLNPSSVIAANSREGIRALGTLPGSPLKKPGSSPASSRAKGPTDGDVVSVPIQPKGGVWSTDVVLGDGHTARFLVDTGASFCVISPAMAEALGIVPPPDARVVTVMTGNGPVSGPLVSIPSIRIGAAEVEGVAAIVLPEIPGFEGILGNSFLSRYAVTLDAERRLLSLRPR